MNITLLLISFLSAFFIRFFFIRKFPSLKVSSNNCCFFILLLLFTNFLASLFYIYNIKTKNKYQDYFYLRSRESKNYMQGERGEIKTSSKYSYPVVLAQDKEFFILFFYGSDSIGFYDKDRLYKFIESYFLEAHSSYNKEMLFNIKEFSQKMYKNKEKILLASGISYHFYKKLKQRLKSEGFSNKIINSFKKEKRIKRFHNTSLVDFHILGDIRSKDHYNILINLNFLKKDDVENLARIIAISILKEEAKSAGKMFYKKSDDEFYVLFKNKIDKKALSLINSTASKENMLLLKDNGRVVEVPSYVKDRIFYGISNFFNKLRREKKDGIKALGKVYTDFNGLSKFYKNSLIFKLKERKGVNGLEAYYNKALKGKVFEKKLTYKSLGSFQGEDLHLSIDANLQSKMNSYIKDLAYNFDCLAVYGGMVNVKTGEILALSQAINVDDSKGIYDIFNYHYEPGSTFKAISLAGVLQAKDYGLEKEVFCEYGSWYYKSTILRDTKQYGNLNILDVVRKSSNIGTAKLSLELSRLEFYQNMKRFGFCNDFSYNVYNSSQVFPHLSKWDSISQSRFAIGQGFKVNIFQMLQAYSIIANKGKKIPLTFSQVRDGEVWDYKRVIPVKTAENLTEALVSVVEYGTGKRAKVSNISIAGKTGTAQKFISKEGAYSQTKYISSFIGFYPSENPKYLVYILIDEPPYSNRYGGGLPAKTFKKFVSESSPLLYLRPEPNAQAFSSQN